jgi:hypothetical protein
MFGWILVIAGIAVAAFFLTRARANPASGKKKSARPKGQYAGLEFIPDKPCCDAATTMGSRRFLISEAPKVPLATCSDPALCRCKYRNVDDRRAGDERRSVVGALSKGMPIGDERTNNRAGRDRRKESISYDYDK